MRFAIASDEGKTVSCHTGHCKCFVVFDIVDNLPKLVEVRENSHTAHAQGLCNPAEDHSHEQAHQHHSHGSLVDALADCRVLISQGMGRRLIEDLQSHNISSIVCNTPIVMDAARLFVSNELPHCQGKVCSKC